MFDLRMYKMLVVLTCLALLVSACGSPAQNESIISTAVAQTVQAGEKTPEVAILATNTPESAINATLTPGITPTSEATLVSAPSDPDCIHAELISEYPPDQTLYAPSEFFWKTWTLKNLGTCTWDSSYQLIFWSGDSMGSSASYPLPEQVLPGEQKDITIYLQAPPTEGSYTGYWRLQTPWNANFGVGQYSQAFYANIVVDTGPRPDYRITGVTYEVVRTPATGCPANVVYTVYATVTTNGAYNLRYFWDQSDQNESAVKTMAFTEAGSQTISREWMIGRGDSPNPRWIQFVRVTPEGEFFERFGQAVILNNCP